MPCSSCSLSCTLQTPRISKPGPALRRTSLFQGDATSRAQQVPIVMLGRPLPWRIQLPGHAPVIVINVRKVSARPMVSFWLTSPGQTTAPFGSELFDDHGVDSMTRLSTPDIRSMLMQ